MSTEITLSTKNIGLGENVVILSDTGTVEFKVGMKIEVDYVNPTAGWVVIWLTNNDGNVVLTHSARIEKKALVLNSRIGGKWGSEERPSGYDFTPGASQTVLLEAEQDYFIIRVNGADLHHYKYRLPVTSIHQVLVLFAPHGGAATPQLKSVSYKY